MLAAMHALPNLYLHSKLTHHIHKAALRHFRCTSGDGNQCGGTPPCIHASCHACFAKSVPAQQAQPTTSTKRPYAIFVAPLAALCSSAADQLRPWCVAASLTACRPYAPATAPERLLHVQARVRIAARPSRPARMPHGAQPTAQARDPPAPGSTLSSGSVRTGAQAWAAQPLGAANSSKGACDAAPPLQLAVWSVVVAQTYSLVGVAFSLFAGS